MLMYTAQQLIQSFSEAGYSDRDIALMIAAHLGRPVHRENVCRIRNGKGSGRNLYRALCALARAWGLV